MPGNLSVCRLESGWSIGFHLHRWGYRISVHHCLFLVIDKYDASRFTSSVFRMALSLLAL